MNRVKSFEVKTAIKKVRNLADYYTLAQGIMYFIRPKELLGCPRYTHDRSLKRYIIFELGKKLKATKTHSYADYYILDQGILHLSYPNCILKAKCTFTLQENDVPSLGDRGPLGVGGGGPNYQRATDHGGGEPGTIIRGFSRLNET